MEWVNLPQVGGVRNEASPSDSDFEIYQTISPVTTVVKSICIEPLNALNSISNTAVGVGVIDAESEMECVALFIKLS